MQLLLPSVDYSRALMGNRDARYDSRHSTMEYIKVHNSCKFPAEAQLENVLVSILHQADASRLKTQARIPSKEKLSSRRIKLLAHQRQSNNPVYDYPRVHKFNLFQTHSSECLEERKE